MRSRAWTIAALSILDLIEPALDGFPRYPKMHPCGLVLSSVPMTDLVPCFESNKGYPTTHFDMDAVEAIGLVKIDILAQGGLAAMRDARQSLASRGITVDLGGLEPWEDPAVWEMIADGGARAVHHIESPAMLSLCRMCNVREIDGLIAIVSVIRPGAANENKKQHFTRRYQGLEPTIYPHPSLSECLKSTFGPDPRSILDHIGGTPLVPMSRISAKLSMPLMGKCEHLDPGGSVKDRIRSPSSTTPSTTAGSAARDARRGDGGQHGRVSPWLRRREATACVCAAGENVRRQTRGPREPSGRG